MTICNNLHRRDTALKSRIFIIKCLLKNVEQCSNKNMCPVTCSYIYLSTTSWYICIQIIQSSFITHYILLLLSLLVYCRHNLQSVTFFHTCDFLDIFETHLMDGWHLVVPAVTSDTQSMWVIHNPNKLSTCKESQIDITRPPKRRRSIFPCSTRRARHTPRGLVYLSWRCKRFRHA